MSEAKHTPGTWETQKARDDEINGGRYRCLRANRKWLGDIRANTAEDDANARLIAAAPDLLAACKAMLDPDIALCKVIMEAEAAVAKAEGE